MRKTNWAVAAGWIAIVVVYAALSRVWTDTDSQWYSSLEEPAFQPPDIVFGIIWPLNYLALAVVGVLLARTHPERTKKALVTFAISVVFALGWSYLFSQSRELVASAVSLVIAAALTWVLVAQLWRARAAYGALLLVYAGWMTLAAALSIGFVVLN